MKKNNYNTYDLIERLHLDPDVDLFTTELNAIRQRNIEKLGRLDPIDLMYDAYKLGFAKALLSHGIELPEEKQG